MTNEEALRVLALSARRSSEKLRAKGNIYLLSFVHKWDEIELRVLAMLNDQKLMQRLREMDQEQYEKASDEYNDALRTRKEKGS